MSDTADTPTVADLHTKVLDAMHAAIEAVKAFLGSPDVVDDTTLHQAAKHADLQMDHALKAMQGVADTVAVVSPPVDEPEPPEETVPDPEPEPKAWTAP